MSGFTLSYRMSTVELANKSFSTPTPELKPQVVVAQTMVDHSPVSVEAKSSLQEFWSKIFIPMSQKFSKKPGPSCLEASVPIAAFWIYVIHLFCVSWQAHEFTFHQLCRYLHFFMFDCFIVVVLVQYSRSETHKFSNNKHTDSSIDLEALVLNSTCPNENINRLKQMIKQYDNFKKPAIFLQGVICRKHMTGLVSRYCFCWKHNTIKAYLMRQKHRQHNWGRG